MRLLQQLHAVIHAKSEMLPSVYVQSLVFVSVS
jgi:hypothetical protein